MIKKVYKSDIFYRRLSSWVLYRRPINHIIKRLHNKYNKKIVIFKYVNMLFINEIT